MNASDLAPKEKWYRKTFLIILAFLSVGPLALPLVLFHPRYALWIKITVTILTVILTYYLIQWTDQTIKAYSAYYDELFALIKQLR